MIDMYSKKKPGKNLDSSILPGFFNVSHCMLSMIPDKQILFQFCVSKP